MDLPVLDLTMSPLTGNEPKTSSRDLLSLNGNPIQVLLLAMMETECSVGLIGMPVKLIVHDAGIWISYINATSIVFRAPLHKLPLKLVLSVCDLIVMEVAPGNAVTRAALRSSKVMSRLVDHQFQPKAS